MSLGVIVAGPCGTGKTTVGQMLAEGLKGEFIEGDSLHPQKNIEKMSNGTPLTDEDRWDWLKEVATQVSSSAEKNGVAVGSCSALTHQYRDYIRQNSTASRLVVVFLHDSKERIFDRVLNRKDHYMREDMVRSQLDLMQIPIEDEPDTVTVVTDKPAEELAKDVLQVLTSLRESS